MRCRDNGRRREVERDRQCEKGVTKALLMAQAGENECAHYLSELSCVAA